MYISVLFLICMSYLRSRGSSARIMIINWYWTPLAKAIQGNPDAKPIIHSDRGFQDTSKVFQSKLQKQGMILSMSRVSRCIDNGPTESFWNIVKSEMFYLTTCTDEDSLHIAIADYMNLYSTERIQGRFNGKTLAQTRAEELATDMPA